MLDNAPKSAKTPGDIMKEAQRKRGNQRLRETLLALGFAVAPETGLAQQLQTQSSYAEEWTEWNGEGGGGGEMDPAEVNKWRTAMKDLIAFQTQLSEMDEANLEALERGVHIFADERDNISPALGDQMTLQFVRYLVKWQGKGDIHIPMLALIAGTYDRLAYLEELVDTLPKPWVVEELLASAPRHHLIEKFDFYKRFRQTLPKIREAFERDDIASVLWYRPLKAPVDPAIKQIIEMHLLKNLATAAYYYPYYADALGVSGKQIFRNSLDRMSSSQIEELLQSGRLTQYASEITDELKTRILQGDLRTIETGMTLFDGTTKEEVSNYPYRLEMKVKKFPASIDWALLYPLAGVTPPEYWQGFSAPVSAERVQPTREKVSPIALLRSFADAHGGRNPLELTQGAYLVFKDIAERGAPMNAEEIAKSVKHIAALREMFGPLDILGPTRRVIGAFGLETLEDGRQRFGRQEFLDALKKRAKSFEWFKAGTQNDDTRELRRKIAYELADSSDPVTFFFHGHGLFVDAATGLYLTPSTKITVDEIVHAFAARYSNEKKRKQAQTIPDALVISACFGFDIGDAVNARLAQLGLPTLLIISSAERSSLGFSEHSNPYSSRFNQLLLDSETIHNFLHPRNLRVLHSKPTLTVPDLIPSKQKSDEKAKKKYRQISGITPSPLEAAVG